MKAKKSFNQFVFDVRTGAMTVALDGITVDEAVSDVSFAVTYERPKGTKVLTHIPQPDVGARMSAYSFLEQYDIVFAVDTNYREISGTRRGITVAAALEIQLTRREDGRPESAVLLESVFGRVEMVGGAASANPERWGWKFALEHLIPQYSGYRRDGRYALLVDSELGMLAEFNARTEPLCDSCVLPSNFTMLYASADAGADLLLNKLMRLADKEASLQLDVLAQGGSLGPFFWKATGTRTESVSGPFA